MANPEKYRKIRSHNPHGFTGGETPSPSTVTLHVRNSNGAPLEAAAVPVVEVIDEYWLVVNLKDFDFEVEDVMALDDQVTACPEYTEPTMVLTTNTLYPAVVDPSTAAPTTTTTTTTAP